MFPVLVYICLVFFPIHVQPSSDLIGLIQVMSAVFGENSPVFARGSQPPPRPSYTPGGPQYNPAAQPRQQTPGMYEV